MRNLKEIYESGEIATRRPDSPPPESHSGRHPGGGVCKAAFPVFYGGRGAGRYSSRQRLRLLLRRR